jgi:TPR repeat protein
MFTTFIARRSAFVRTIVGGLILAATIGSANAATDTAAIKCAQKQLNVLGFSAGIPDGIVGVRTFIAGETYIGFMRAVSETGWKQPSLGPTTAALWCEKVAEAHPKVAVYWKMYQRQLQTDSPDALSDPKKIYEMALKFETGSGAAPDEVLAARWYLRAAQLGFAPAQRNLAEMSRLGRGIEKNATSARYWYLLAAMQGDAPAQFAVGMYYASSEQAKIDWLWKAALQGHRGAITELERSLDI